MKVTLKESCPPGSIERMSLHEEIGRGARSVVYRATSDTGEYAVKFYHGDCELEEAERRYRREAAVHAGLRHPAVPAIYETGVHDAKPYIISEYVRGQTLAEKLLEGPLGAERTIALGAALADALDLVHLHGLIHRDIKPKNIMIDEAEKATLIDFGLAGHDLDKDSREVAGTLRYSAPEQTGMLERAVDGRADLYGLGNVLYESLLGQPPFTCEDITELLYHHAAVKPTPLTEVVKGCDPVLASIIEKLLCKDPDDRYQSAKGLSDDLSGIEQLRETARTMGQLVLDGRSHRRAPRGIFVGRNTELHALERVPRAIKKEAGGIFLIDGAPGNGKTRLIEELIHREIPADVLVLRGKCAEGDPYPLAPIREAIFSHLDRVNAQTGPDRERALETIAQAAGEMCGVLQQLGPAMAKVLQESVEGGASIDGGVVFRNALSAFLVNLADLKGGCLLWIDDVQWLDDASNAALKVLASQIHAHPFVLLLTCRNDETSEGQIERLQRTLKPHHPWALSLEPLCQADVEEIIVRELGTRLDPSFIRQLTTRSHGNPLVILQYLQAMKDNGLLFPSWGDWVIDQASLNSLELPTEIYDLMVSRLTLLSNTAQEILAVAALLGTNVVLDQLRNVCDGRSLSEVQQALSEGMEARLIEQSTYGDDLAFVHDRVREALIIQIGEERAELHRRAADYLGRQKTLQGRQVYEYARHCMLGYAETRPKDTFLACLKAAEVALKEHAYAKAHDLLQFAAGLEISDELTVDSLLAFNVASGTAGFQTERVDEAAKYFSAALELADTPVERAQLRAKLARTAIFEFNTHEGARQLELAFEDLGRRLPSSEYQDPAVLKSELIKLMQEHLGIVMSGKEAGSAQGEDRTVQETLIDLGDIAFLIGYYDRNPLMALQGGVVSLLPAHHLGESPEACQGFATFAILMGLIGKAELSEKFGDIALSMAKKLGGRQTLAMTQSTVAIAKHFSGDVDAALQLQREVFQSYGAWLGPLAFQNCCIDLAWNCFIRGYHQEELAVSSRAVQRLEDKGGPFIGAYVCRASASAMSASATLGHMQQAVEYSRRVEKFRSVVPADRTIPWVSVEGYLANFLLQQETLGDAFEEAVERHQAWGIPPERSALHSKHFYVCHAYARLEAALRAGKGHHRSGLALFRAALDELEATASTPTLRAHFLVLKANAAIFDGDLRAADARLDEAQDLCYRFDNPWGLCECVRTRARVLQAKRIDTGVLHEAHRATMVATQHSWRHRRRQIEAEFQLTSGMMPTNQDRSDSQYGSSADISGTSRLQRQLEALLSLSRASTSILDPDEQARVALDQITRLVGAERAYLFIADDNGELSFQAGRSAAREDLCEPRAYSRTTIQRVYDTGQPLVLSTRADARELHSESVVAFDLRSVLAAPLRAVDRILGVLYLDNRLASGIFTQEHVELIRALGSQIAAGLQTARAAQLELQLQAETERRRLAETLREFNTRLTSTLKLNESLERLVDMLGRQLDFDRALVTIHDENGLEPMVVRGFPEEDLPSFFKEESFARTIENLQGAKVLSGSSVGLDPADSLLVLPLRSRDASSGFVFIIREEPIRQDDIEFILTLVGQASIAIENARLFRRVKTLAEMDGLTGLYNRREFFRLAEAAFDDLCRRQQPVAVMMFDIDHFKRFNDSYGHAVGDEVLRMVARASRQSVRKSDILGRYGGEEFVVLLPGTPRSVSKSIAERLRAAIEQTQLATERFGALSVTVSVGLATWCQGDSLSSLLSRADQALYASKAHGRNMLTA